MLPGPRISATALVCVRLLLKKGLVPHFILAGRGSNTTFVGHLIPIPVYKHSHEHVYTYIICKRKVWW